MKNKLRGIEKTEKEIPLYSEDGHEDQLPKEMMKYWEGRQDRPLWNFSSRNRVTPVSIQDGVQHGITFAAISTIPAVPSPISAELLPISAELSLIPAALS